MGPYHQIPVHGAQSYHMGLGWGSTGCQGSILACSGYVGPQGPTPVQAGQGQHRGPILACRGMGSQGLDLAHRAQSQQLGPGRSSMGPLA